MTSTLKTLSLIASATVLLALSGCSMEKLDRADGILPSANAATISEPTAGHEMHTMFEAQKRSAAEAELPAQF